jgi:hypothetical protein
MPSPVHESITSIITDGFAIAKGTLPAPIRRKINAVANQDFTGFGGQYRWSEKIPDLAIEFENAAGELEAKFILEVGFTETYEDLVRDAKLWLEGKPGVCTVMVVKFEETPSFRCPARGLDDEQLERLEFPEASEIDELNFIIQPEYGPVRYKGLEWVGCISTAFAEVWRRHPVSGLATQSGNRIVGYHQR